VRLAPRGSFLVITDRGGAAAVRRRVTVRRVRGRAGREEDEVLGMQPATRRGYLHPWNMIMTSLSHLDSFSYKQHIATTHTAVVVRPIAGVPNPHRPFQLGPV